MFLNIFKVALSGLRQNNEKCFLFVYLIIMLLYALLVLKTFKCLNLKNRVVGHI